MATRLTKRTLQPFVPKSFKVLTYNVKSKEEINLLICMKMISKIILDNLPDVVCLLDVSVSGYTILMKLLKLKYVLFQVFIEAKNTFGEVLLCLRETTEIPEGTQPYYYDLTLGGKGRVVGTELLIKSLNSHVNILLTKLKSVDQFPLIEQVEKSLRNVILIGDFPADEIAHNYCDAWIKMGCPSYLRNYRTARILWTRETDIIPSQLALLGMACIKKINVLPSGHFGLMATFQKKST